MSTGEEVIAGLSGAADKVNSSAASVADGGERWIEASTSFAIAHNKRKERDKALRERDELLRRAAALREKAMGLDAEASAAEVRGLALAGEGRERIGQAKQLADEALTDALSVMEGSQP